MVLAVARFHIGDRVFLFDPEPDAQTHLSALSIYYLDEMFTTALDVLLSGAAQHAPHTGDLP
jgi:hypothetical protein